MVPGCRINGVMPIILPVGPCDICERPALLRAVKRPVLHTLSLCRVCHGRLEFILSLSTNGCASPTQKLRTSTPMA
jgi:hypothetical protein